MHTHPSVSTRTDLIWYSMAFAVGAFVVLFVNLVLEPESLETAQASHEVMMQVDLSTAQLLEWQLRRL